MQEAFHDFRFCMPLRTFVSADSTAFCFAVRGGHSRDETAEKRKYVRSGKVRLRSRTVVSLHQRA